MADFKKGIMGIKYIDKAKSEMMLDDGTKLWYAHGKGRPLLTFPLDGAVDRFYILDKEETSVKKLKKKAVSDRESFVSLLQDHSALLVTIDDRLLKKYPELSKFVGR